MPVKFATLPAGPFKVIYADPPWGFKAWSRDMGRRTAESFYRTLSVGDLCDLPVHEVVDKDCALFLWVPSALLEEGIRLMNAWGFYYKTIAFVWVKHRNGGKLHFGMGHWTRQGAEVVLMGVTGSPKRVARNVRQVLMAPLREHSRKPADVRDRIVYLMGDVPRLELFAREIVQGWEVWGDEVHRFA